MAMLITLTATTLASMTVAFAPPTYEATVLPQIDDTDSEFKLTYTTPWAMNNSGVITGELGNQRGFRWSPVDGSDELQPHFADVAEGARGIGINSAGLIVGVYTPAGTFAWRPFQLTADGTFTPLPTLGPNLSAGASDVNDAGMVVGSGERASGGTFGGPQSSLYWTNGLVKEIGGFGGPASEASAVNNNGVVVGYSNIAAGQPAIPYIWTGPNQLNPLPQYIEGVPAVPADINDNNVVVGRAGLSLFQNIPVYWDASGDIHALPTVTTNPVDVGVLAVNNDEVMVGFELVDDFEARLWLDGEVYVLQDYVTNLPAGITLARAVDVNDSGQIVVEAHTIVEDQIQFITVLLTPVTACAGDAVSSETFAPPGDGVIDGADLAFLLGEWGRNPGSAADVVDSKTFAPPADGVVNAADLAFLLGSWGACN